MHEECGEEDPHRHIMFLKNFVCGGELFGMVARNQA